MLFKLGELSRKQQNRIGLAAYPHIGGNDVIAEADPIPVAGSRCPFDG